MAAEPAGGPERPERRPIETRWSGGDDRGCRRRGTGSQAPADRPASSPAEIGGRVVLRINFVWKHETEGSKKLSWVWVPSYAALTACYANVYSVKSLLCIYAVRTLICRSAGCRSAGRPVVGRPVGRSVGPSDRSVRARLMYGRRGPLVNNRPIRLVTHRPFFPTSSLLHTSRRLYAAIRRLPLEQPRAVAAAPAAAAAAAATIVSGARRCPHPRPRRPRSKSYPLIRKGRR